MEGLKFDGYQYADNLIDSANVKITTKYAQDMLASDASFPVTNTNNTETPNERQILVDPISLSKPPEKPRPMLRPIVTTRNGALLPPLSPAKLPRLLSVSLPGSATSSPKSGSKKKWRNLESPYMSNSPDSSQISPAYSLASRQESFLQRSKSCGEGRASAFSDEFTLCISKSINNIDHENKNQNGSFNYIEAGKNSIKGTNKVPDEEFKCGSLCLYLPGFGKGKPVRPQHTEVPPEMQRNEISRTVSLERFECGSWASSAIKSDHEDEGESSVNLYYDLPLELIKTSVNDAHSPVTTAFVFDKNHKGVLKNSKTAAGKSSATGESGRHVRFSTSSPRSRPVSPTACITPRLRKARDEFNAFLEAQSA